MTATDVYSALPGLGRFRNRLIAADLQGAPLALSRLRGGHDSCQIIDAAAIDDEPARSGPSTVASTYRTSNTRTEPRNQT